MKQLSILKSRHQIQGATIIEVLVSVFLLTFGILALMAAQIRSVAGIGEAENRTLIAQAAEALAEGMQANPELSFSATSATSKQLNLSYKTLYARKNHDPSATTKTEYQSLSSITGNTRKNLADFQLENFDIALNGIPDISTIRYSICADKNEPEEPVMDNNGVMDDKCATSGQVSGAVIKVAWQMNNKNDADTKITYTYLLKVKG